MVVFVFFVSTVLIQLGSTGETSKRIQWDNKTTFDLPCGVDWHPYEFRPENNVVAGKIQTEEAVIEDPFLEANPFFEEKALSYQLDCDSGLARFDCFTDARSVCDAFCKNQCYLYFPNAMPQVNLMHTLKEHGSEGCAFRFRETVEIQASVCRRELSYAIEAGRPADFLEQATVYLIQPNWTTISLANYKRLKKAALTLPLESKFSFNPTIPRDFGNFLRVTDRYDIEACDIVSSRLSFFFTDISLEPIYRTHFGARYSLDPVEQSGKGIYTYDINYLLRPSALAAIGGLPKQFLLWWPGIQPKLSNGDASDTAAIKLLFNLPPTRYFTGKGIFNIEDTHCKIPRPTF